MKLIEILKEVTDGQSREMITGIADILRDVKDKANREAIAKRMIRKFEREGVKYNAEEFMKLVGIETGKLQEIGETTAQPYPLTLKDESVYYAIWEFKTDADRLYRIVIGKDYADANEEAVIYEVSFGVYEGATLDFGAEVNDPKNMYRVMATVVKAIKDTMADEINQTELPVAKIVIEPTKREIDAPGSALPVYDKGDTRRADFYMKYIQKQMPAGAEVRSTADKGRIEILLPTE